MQTPTLTEARRALLELRAELWKLLADNKIDRAFTPVVQYLDAQVPLNVENINAYYGKMVSPEVANQPGINDILTKGFSVDPDVVVVPVSLRQAKTFGTTVSFATKAERDAFALAMFDRANKDLDAFMKPTPAGPQAPTPKYEDIVRVEEHIMQGRNANVPRVPWPYEGLTTFDEGTACPKCIDRLTKQPGCEHD